MLTVGQQAPAIESRDQDGNPITLAQFLGQKVALFFYPKDNTSACTAQACSMRDHLPELNFAGYQVIGVSIDNEKSHRKFIANHGLNYPLLADVDHKIVNDYAVWGEKMLYGRKYMGTIRITFLIDEHGIITRIIDKVNTKEHAQQILETV
jgi:peroxiredoxin Q/BCP